MTSIPCYLIMAGGTGGHIFPAMAVARSFIQKGADVHWLGTETGMEFQLVPAEKIPLHLIKIKGFRGKGILAKLSIPFLLVKAVWQAYLVIKKINPDVVIGFGGYVAAPGGIASRLLRKKLIIHEQNSVAGSTNKLLAKISSYSLEAFPKSLPNAIRVGNPIRKDISELYSFTDTKNQSKVKNVLIMGGSLGAEAINKIMPKVINSLSLEERPAVWHQTGKNKKSDIEIAYKNVGLNVRVDEFIGDVAGAYRWADIIICRAGALTVSEITVAGIPAIFIPYPYAIDNHQFHNAKWLLESEAAFLIEQKDLDEERLANLLKKLIGNDELLEAISKKLKLMAVPDSTDQVVSICERVNRNEKILGDNNAA